MEIRFTTQQVKAFETEVAELRNKGQQESFVGSDLLFSFVQPSFYSLEKYLQLFDAGVQITGFAVYLRMTTVTYNNDTVPVNVTGATREEENPTPPPDTITVNQIWNEWQPLTARTSNNGLEVIINAGFNNQPATREDIEEFLDDPNVVEVFGADVLLGQYDNDVDWVVDENNVPVTEPPVEKTALYWVGNWDTDGEAFDFLHAQRLANQWFNNLPGASRVDKFNSLDAENKRGVIRMGILLDTSTEKALIEATILNPRNREIFRRWHIERLIQAREKRFNDAWAYLVDNFKNNAIIALDRLEDMLAHQLRNFYIYRGSSNQNQHLIVNGAINADFWSTFSEGDVAYTDRTLDDIRTRVERILDGNRY